MDKTRFIWNVNEATDEMPEVDAGGGVDLTALEIPEINNQWKLSKSDGKKGLQPIPSGTVEDFETTNEPTEPGPSNSSLSLNLNLGKNIYELGFLIFILAFVLGFIAIVVNGVVRDNLSLETYFWLVGSFLASTSAYLLGRRSGTRKRLN